MEVAKIKVVGAVEETETMITKEDTIKAREIDIHLEKIIFFLFFLTTSRFAPR